jgi:hypothetical protein
MCSSEQPSMDGPEEHLNTQQTYKRLTASRTDESEGGRVGLQLARRPLRCVLVGVALTLLLSLCTLRESQVDMNIIRRDR